MSETNPVTLLIRTALRIADQAVVADIETEGIRIGPATDRRWCVAGMLNPHEHSPAVLDMLDETIAYGVARGLLLIEPGVPHTIRILRHAP